MEITATQQTRLFQLGISMFNAALGVTYLHKLEDFISSGYTMYDLANSLAASPDFKVLYPDILSNAQFATRLVDKMADGLIANSIRTTAISELTDQLNAGMTRGALMLAATEFLDANTSSAWQRVATQLQNRVDVAKYYTLTKGGAATDIATLASTIADVTDMATSVTTAKTSVDTLIVPSSSTPDTTAPSAPTGLILAAADDLGTSSTDSITSRVSGLTINGKAEADATVKLYDSGVLMASGKADTSGAFAIDLILRDGAHSVTAKATDAAGNIGAASTTLAITIDTVAPTQTISGIHISADTGTSSTDFFTATAAQTITATLSAMLGASEVLMGSVDSGTTWTDITSMVAGTAVSWTGATLSGNNSIMLKAMDTAGNSGAVLSQAYSVSSTAGSGIAATTLTLSAANATLSTTASTNVTPTGFFFTSGAESIDGGSNRADSANLADATAADADVLNAILTGGTFATPTWTKIETINLTTNMTAAMSLLNVTGATAINISNSVAQFSNAQGQPLLLSSGYSSALTANVATAASSGVSITLAGTGAAASVTTNSTNTASAAIALVVSSNSTLAGLDTAATSALINISGSGNLSVSDATTTGTVSGASMTGTLTFSDTNATIITGSPQADSFTQATAANASVNGGAGNDTFAFGALLTTGDTINGGDGTDSLSFTDAGGATTDIDKVANIETITLGNAATAFNTVETNIGASAILTIDGAAVTTAANVITISAALETDGGRVSMTGGAGNDVLTGGASADTITGGAGADVINGGTGNDTYVFGATITDSNISTTATAAAGFDTVTVSVGDILDFNAVVAACQAVPVASGVALGADGTTVLGQLETAFLVGDDAAANIEAAVITFTGGEQFLVVDTDSSQTITAADQVVKLVGIVVAGISIASGNLVIA